MADSSTPRKGQLELVIDRAGGLGMVYSDEAYHTLKAALGGTDLDPHVLGTGIVRVASVEFEESDGCSGWSVRSTVSPQLALRRIANGDAHVSTVGALALFPERARAVEEELKNFWTFVELLKEKA